MDYQNNYQKYREKEEKIDVLLALHELLISAFHNAVYLQNFGIDNVRIINKINEYDKENMIQTLLMMMDMNVNIENASNFSDDYTDTPSDSSDDE